MDSQKVNGFSPKENGSHRRPLPYSVETPYGFHLDLDFLKYVDDIEKGNTIKRVQIQRKQRNHYAGSLSRNLSLPGYGCRAPQWNSIGTLFPKSRLADSEQSSGSAGLIRQSETVCNSFTAVEMQATIQAFDEQPLGLHVRPNLLRASSLPLTVLLRKHSESTEDPTSPNGSRDYLAQENGSSEDVFHSPERKIGGVNGTLQQLTAALQRVAELEGEVKDIPELRAQICILQEERERLLLKVQSQNGSMGHSEFSGSQPQSSVTSDSISVTELSKAVQDQNKSNDDWMNREYEQLEENVKASSEQVDAMVIPLSIEKAFMGIGDGVQVTKIVKDIKDPLDHGERTKSLTEALQRKVVMLEQKLHELESELDKTQDLLTEQMQESCVKDERIKELTKNTENVWVRIESAATHLDRVDNAALTEPSSKDTSVKPLKSEQSVLTHSQEPSNSGQACLEGDVKPLMSREPAGSHADMEHHVKRVQELLNEQWECLCRVESSGRVLSSEHLPPRVCSIQEQLASLVSLLSVYVSAAGEAPTPAQESKTEDQIPVVDKCREGEITLIVSARERPGDVQDVGESSVVLKEHNQGVDQEILQTEAIQPQLWSITPAITEQTARRNDPPETTNGSGDAKDITTETDIQEQTSEVESLDDQPVNGDVKQDSTCSVAESQESSQGEGGRETKVDKDFMTACYFLKEHMDEVAEPNDEMRQALMVVFQKWFHIAAEEDSCANTVALYINEVATETPTVLQFLINMVDDNGNTALHYSLSHSNFNIVKLLLDTGMCEVDLRNKIGYTAIMLASLISVDSPEDIKVIQQLMEFGDVNARVGQVGQTALHLAVRHGRASTVRLLLTHGANINAQDRAGTTALISACDRGHTNIVRILLDDPDCDVNLTDKGGRSALSLATQASHTEIADLLKARTHTKGQDKCKMA
ncbi:KN motif and ankyrin repeat domain-containing protein 4-like isoform X2 [Brachyhypopomus gauderio]|uniref:KN motif and ankyrin repeat domain-containing protein 4-like isoform X2 n=1 Tax=Brachyhypopomus gauderio TaxID=698409 RepID=UPI0040427CF7